MRRLAFALACALGLAGLAAAAPAVPRDIDFKVEMDGDEIGHHRVSFSTDGTFVFADVDIKLEVYVAFIRAFVYEHRSRETWLNGELVAVTSTTNDDGAPMELSLTRAGDGLQINGTKFQGAASAALLPTSYWMKQTVAQTELIDSQNGRVFPVTIRSLGEETIEINGVPVATQRYALTGELTLDLWYDLNGNWVKSSFDARGATLTYIKQSPLSQQARLR